MTLFLLVLAVVLLLAILAILLSGWPGRERRALEDLGRELRRELAQSRTDTVQLLHAMKIELEESLREAVEEEVASLAAAGRKRASSVRRSPAPRRALGAFPPSAPSGRVSGTEAAVVSEEAEEWPVPEEESGQLRLFAEDPRPDLAPLEEAPVPEPVAATLPQAPPEEEMIRVYAAADLPDVD